jgi:hypothetical protein
MGKGFALLAVLASAMVVATASAQTDAPRRQHHAASSTAPNQPGADTATFNLQRKSLSTERFAIAARELMKKGDCEGALNAFDQALNESVDSTLNRDRGMCHEQLGHPYPAIDDYQAYLTNAPDAPDADDIRDRLERLRAQVRGLPSPGLDAEREDREGPPKGEPGATAPMPDDKAEAETPDVVGDDQPPSSLRQGKGWVLAPFFAARKWFRDGRTFGDRETWAEALGGQVRYAFASRSTLILEAGYQRFNANNVDVETVSGLTSEFAYELRIPLNTRFDDQLLFAPGVGYEQLSYEASADLTTPTYSEGAITGRLRFGYRHMLARSVAIDLSIEGGGGGIIKYDASLDLHAGTFGLAGTSVALAWGL